MTEPRYYYFVPYLVTTDTEGFNNQFGKMWMYHVEKITNEPFRPELISTTCTGSVDFDLDTHANALRKELWAERFEHNYWRDNLVCLDEAEFIAWNQKLLRSHFPKGYCEDGIEHHCGERSPATLVMEDYEYDHPEFPGQKRKIPRGSILSRNLKWHIPLEVKTTATYVSDSTYWRVSRDLISAVALYTRWNLIPIATIRPKISSEFVKALVEIHSHGLTVLDTPEMLWRQFESEHNKWDEDTFLYLITAADYIKETAEKLATELRRSTMSAQCTGNLFMGLTIHRVDVTQEQWAYVEELYCSTPGTSRLTYNTTTPENRWFDE